MIYPPPPPTILPPPPSRPLMDIRGLLPVVPSMLLGPWGKGFFIDAADYGALAGDIAIYNLITPDGDFLQYGAYIDTRDIAKVHVLLLNAPPTAEVGQKRVILSSPHEYEYAAILKFIAEERPALKERLIKGEPPQLLMSKLTTGAERVQKLTGLGAGDFQPLKSVGFSFFAFLLFALGGNSSFFFFPLADVG